MNSLRITDLKVSTFASYKLNIYFLRITATKVSNFTGPGQKHETLTNQPNFVFLPEPTNFDTLAAVIHKKC